MNYRGTIIEESLEDKAILDEVPIMATRVELVERQHQTPWLAQWTLHTIELPEKMADEVAKRISDSLETEHSWYADFKNENWHYIIYSGKIFKVDRKDTEGYLKAQEYGISMGIPEYQVNFSPDIE